MLIVEAEVVKTLFRFLWFVVTLNCDSLILKKVMYCMFQALFLIWKLNLFAFLLMFR